MGRGGLERRPRQAGQLNRGFQDCRGSRAGQVVRCCLVARGRRAGQASQGGPGFLEGRWRLQKYDNEHSIMIILDVGTIMIMKFLDWMC